MKYLSETPNIVIKCEHGSFYADSDDIEHHEGLMFIDAGNGYVQIFEEEIYEL